LALRRSVRKDPTKKKKKENKAGEGPYKSRGKGNDCGDISNTKMEKKLGRNARTVMGMIIHKKDLLGVARSGNLEREDCARVEKKNIKRHLTRFRQLMIGERQLTLSVLQGH